jgi:hypothetical protein
MPTENLQEGMAKAASKRLSLILQIRLLVDGFLAAILANECLSFLRKFRSFWQIEIFQRVLYR